MRYHRLELEAVNASQNIFRYYTLEACQDLLGDWLLTTRYGRKGYKGQVKCYGFTDKHLLEKKWDQIVHKRLHAEKRIGCNYRVSKEIRVP